MMARQKMLHKQKKGKKRERDERKRERESTNNNPRTETQIGSHHHIYCSMESTVFYGAGVNWRGFS